MNRCTSRSRSVRRVDAGCWSPPSWAAAVALLDSTVVNNALPTLGPGSRGGLRRPAVDGQRLHVDPGRADPAGGSLADRYGRRQVFVVGLARFAVASLQCGLAPGVPTLIAARMLQADWAPGAPGPESTTPCAHLARSPPSDGPVPFTGRGLGGSASSADGPGRECAAFSWKQASPLGGHYSLVGRPRRRKSPNGAESRGVVVGGGLYERRPSRRLYLEPLRPPVRVPCLSDARPVSSSCAAWRTSPATASRSLAPRRPARM